MILRLIIALARWTWGISPAFIKPDRINEAYAFTMAFGVIMDIAIVAFAILAFVDWYNRRKREGGAK